MPARTGVFGPWPHSPPAGAAPRPEPSPRCIARTGRCALAQELTIGMLWVEGQLSYLEQLCMVSFRDAGHPVRLYTYGAVSRVPEGIEVRPAAEILPREGFHSRHTCS